MGGVSLGYSPIYNLNLTNPAGYSALVLTTFETAVNMNQVEMKTAAKKQDLNNTSFSYFAFGFPIKSKKNGVPVSGFFPSVMWAIQFMRQRQMLTMLLKRIRMMVRED